jgi:hypothetical protein
MLTLPPVGVDMAGAVEKFITPRTAMAALAAGGGTFNMPTLGMGMGAV